MKLASGAVQSGFKMLASLAKEIIARCLLWSGIVRTIRLLLWRDRVLIIVYHDPKPQVVNSHLTYLRKIAEPISLSQLCGPSHGRPRVIITIDDGHMGNRELLEVFRAHGVRPTIFLCSCIVGTRRQFWWRHSKAVAERVEHFKKLWNPERLSRLAEHGFEQDAETESPAALSIDDVERMKSWVDFQSHGRFHPILTRCDDEECEREIAQSRHEIAQLVLRDCLHFAFPNGDYSGREIEMLKSAGYRTARTLDVGWNDSRTDTFRLKAVPVSDDASPAWFAVQISFIPACFRLVRRTLLGPSPHRLTGSRLPRRPGEGARVRHRRPPVAAAGRDQALP
jgi:peptidoglycan/xylan/chitin deacetylase (PgdA/CDA1 family)